VHPRDAGEDVRRHRRRQQLDISLMKASPSGFMDGPGIREEWPNSTPATIPAMTWRYKGFGWPHSALTAWLLNLVAAR